MAGDRTTNDSADTSLDRRSFLRSTAAVGSAVSMAAEAYGRIPGSNTRISVAMLGCGGRAQAHVHALLKFKADGMGVSIGGVCDVWDGQDDTFDHEFPPGVFTRRTYAQGLYPTAKKAGLTPTDSARVTKDYRRLLDLKEIDAVCVATPDHWHARMTLDALSAGKDVVCERPMTRTAEEAVAVMDAADRFNRVVQIGVQSAADPSCSAALEIVRSGRIGPISALFAGAFRNDIRGQWRYYRLTPQMTPRSIDWDQFLGHRFEIDGVPLGPGPADQPFDRAVFAQWRCYSAFSSGVISDLLFPAIVRMTAASGLRFPRQVVTAGGLHWEHDGRTVPDHANVSVTYDGGAVLTLLGSTTSAYPIEETVRGRFGTIKFVKGGIELHRDDPTRGAGLPGRLEKSLTPAEAIAVTPPGNETHALWADFLDAVRTHRRAVLCGPDIAGPAAVTAAMASESLHRNRPIYWDHERRRISEVDPHRPEESSLRTESNRTTGMQPPKYMRLAGPWVDGRPPENDRT